MAEESRYVARSALIATEACQHARRGLLAARERHRLWQVLQRPLAGSHIPGGAKAFQGTPLRDRTEHRDRTAAVGYLEGLAGFDATKQLAGSLAQLSDAHSRHVLLVAPETAIRHPQGFRRSARRPLRGALPSDLSGSVRHVLAFALLVVLKDRCANRPGPGIMTYRDITTVR
jgi:hypothetical protein